MTDEPALTPPLALDYLRELSADIVAGVVLAPDGARLAGPDALAEPARDLLASARSEQHAIAVVCGRFALPSLIRYDLRKVLADLAGGKRPEAA